ncbi:hypothetical protein glysoja_024993 [Glycine soja]|uniref:Uncharacterized protein n=1 Tax=Glycine soja TaxID=3848 RepID=A0A0B2PXB4_GLYSO|nr:hypothetical protein glysoja_024993 [Glycine soja]
MSQDEIFGIPHNPQRNIFAPSPHQARLRLALDLSPSLVHNSPSSQLAALPFPHLLAPFHHPFHVHCYLNLNPTPKIALAFLKWITYKQGYKHTPSS